MTLSDDLEEARRRGYRHGFNDGFKKGYDRGYEEGFEKGKLKNRHSNTTRFMKISCECGSVNFHPVFDNRLVINTDEERRCHACQGIIPREVIFAHYSRLQSNKRTR
ncbi:MAG: hypothetical protein OEZ35_04105 [Candidatus Bathyarchaeota archaeon]|nr:hypothetical protein [Candidatus Bathyarchaeota archaeon]